jgi:hypothetical protein
MDRGSPQYTIIPFDWHVTDPQGVPELVIRTYGRNPWTPQLTILIGSFEKDQWMLVPYALRRLCREIPDLPKRTVSIKRDASKVSALAVYIGGEDGQYQLVFSENNNNSKNNDNEDPYPLRLGLGAKWCSQPGSQSRRIE